MNSEDSSENDIEESTTFIIAGEHNCYKCGKEISSQGDNPVLIEAVFTDSVQEVVYHELCLPDEIRAIILRHHIAEIARWN